MSGIATAVVAGAVISGVASNSAAKKQAGAADRASQVTQDQYAQNREDQMPWRDAGVQALGQLTTGTQAGGDLMRNFTMADFNQDPGYAFRQQQGQRGVESSAAARGGVLSGGAIKAVDRYNQDYASGEYQNAYNRFNNDQTQRFNRLSSLAGVGQNATNNIGAEGSALAGAVGQNTMQAANARASGYVGTANAVNSGIQTLGGFSQQQALLGALKPSSLGAGVGTMGNAGYGDYTNEALLKSYGG